MWDTLDALTKWAGQEREELACSKLVSRRVQQVLRDVCSSTPDLFDCCAITGALQLFAASQARKNILGSIGVLAAVELCISDYTMAAVLDAMLVHSEMKTKGS